MTHPAYLLSRLNPKNVRFDVGPGGTAELTPADIAAGLAMVPAGLGRELMCRVWWPDGARNDVLDSMLLQLQLAEHGRREQAMYAALAGVAAGYLGDDRRKAHAAYATAHANRWPQWITKLEPLEVSECYALMRKMAVEEITHPRNCPACHGRGHVARGELLVACERCEGAGRVQFGPTWRSRRLGMKEASFKKTWERPYEWLFAKMSEELREAERELSKAVG